GRGEERRNRRAHPPQALVALAQIARVASPSRGTIPFRRRLPEIGRSRPVVGKRSPACRPPFSCPCIAGYARDAQMNRSFHAHMYPGGRGEGQRRLLLDIRQVRRVLLLGAVGPARVRAVLLGGGRLVA